MTQGWQRRSQPQEIDTLSHQVNVLALSVVFGSVATKTPPTGVYQHLARSRILNADLSPNVLKMVLQQHAVGANILVGLS